MWHRGRYTTDILQTSPWLPSGPTLQNRSVPQAICGRAPMFRRSWNAMMSHTSGAPCQSGSPFPSSSGRRDVDGDTSRLVLRQDLRLPCLGIVVAGAEVRQRLPIGVPDDIAAVRSACQGAGKRRPSFGARRRLVVVWPPAHWRDLQWRSLPRIDPATRRAPTWPAKRIRPAATVCYPQRDVFIERRALDWIPAIVHLRRPHCALSQFSVSV
jgi:hypothetical protein